jgi:hypothetical protein
VSENGRLCRRDGVEEQSDGGIGSFILPILQTLSTIISFRPACFRQPHAKDSAVLEVPPDGGF